MIVQAWQMREIGEPLIRTERRLEPPESDHVTVRVAGCGLCDADVGYMTGGDAVGHPLPLTLGHEVAGVVVEAGPKAADWLGRSVIVPSVIPCETCEHCRTGRGRICLCRTRVGCDIHGGFASHVLVPARGLCAVDEDELASSSVALSELAVLVEAVSAPYEAIARLRLVPDDVAVFVGVGGIGAFGVQIASVLDAHVIALDTDDAVLAEAIALGASHAMNIRDRGPAAIRRHVHEYVRRAGIRDCCWKVFEMSRSIEGIAAAFELLTLGAQLAIVGYMRQEVRVHLGNLTAFDATVQGVSGCQTGHYAEALDLILAGDLEIAPFAVRAPMSTVNDMCRLVRDTRLRRRPILVPDFD